MASLLRSLTGRSASRNVPITLDDLASWFGYGGLQYPVMSSSSLQQGREEIGGDFLGYIEGAYKSNGVIFACMLARLSLFAEARFQFRRIRMGRPGDMWGTGGCRSLRARGRAARPATC
jgi:hypothetical protein